MTSGEIVLPGFGSRDHVACAICPYLRAVLIVAAAYALNAAAAASSEATPARSRATAAGDASEGSAGRKSPKPLVGAQRIPSRSVNRSSAPAWTWGSAKN